MLVNLEDVKQYLRVDFDDDDALISGLIQSAENICRDILRTDELQLEPDVKLAILYAVAYFYENRESADHHGLMLTLRNLLFGSREGGF